jgi:hypothetical protein
VTSRWRGLLVSEPAAGAGFNVDLMGDSVVAGGADVVCARAGKAGSAGIVMARTSIRVARIGLYSTTSNVGLNGFSSAAKLYPWSICIE